ncbi:MAG: aldo/keto reductase [Isosphaeraceae bacterium]|nr:aldo/keto reductase [Isosphaeraceae bacterium]
MSQDQPHGTDRRSFLQAGTLAAAAAAAGTGSALAQDPPAPVIPKRKLGKTGVEVTMLNQGAIRGSQTERVLRFSYASGVRVFDTAKVYGTEPTLRRWFEAMPEVRKNIFLVTKDMPKDASEIPAMVDDRLKSLGVDSIDLFFIHGFGDAHKLDVAVDLIKSPELGRVVDAVKKSGKIKHFGFSSHHKDRAALITAAAEGGIVDAIMLQYRPWLEKESPLNKAIDAAWKANIGLISMKQIAGNFFGDKPEGNILDDVKKKVPMLEERKLSPFQGLLHAIWTDERISTVCVSMRNTDQIRENVDACRRYEPLKTADILQLRDAALAARHTLCADCDGRCSEAAGTRAELGNLTRFLTYHEQHGDRIEARRAYAALAPEARDWAGADLDAARRACPSNLDFASLLPEADELLA